MKSKMVALSAISASFIAFFLSLGAYVEIFDMATVVIASFFVCLPLCKKWYSAGFFTYLAGGILAFLISGLNYLSLVFPSYFLFFGIFPIVKKIMSDKNIKKWIYYLVGILWSVAICVGLYYYYTFFMGVQVTFTIEWLNNFAIPIVVLFGVMIFLLYSHFLTKGLIFAEQKIDKFINR